MPDPNPLAQTVQAHAKGRLERPRLAAPGEPEYRARVARTGLSHRHQAIAEFLMTHPEMSLREIAPNFGYTEAYFYMLVNSNAFQDYYSALIAHNLDDRILPLRDRTQAVAGRALDKLNKELDRDDLGGEFYLDVANKLLQRAMPAVGGAPAQPVGGPQLTQINNYYSSDMDQLERARRRMAQFYDHLEGEGNDPGEASGPDDTAAGAQPAAQLQAHPYGDLGPNVHRAAALDAPGPEAPGGESPWAELRTEGAVAPTTDVRPALPTFPLD